MGHVSMQGLDLSFMRDEKPKSICKDCDEELRPSIEHPGRLYCSHCGVYPAVTGEPTLATGKRGRHKGARAK